MCSFETVNMMYIFGYPIQTYIDVLTKNGCIDKLYDAINEEDLSNAVMAFLKTIYEIGTLEHYSINLDKHTKCIETSNSNREDGNEQFRERDYGAALLSYNLALMSAPPDSESMILAYSNRSALFFEVKAISACLRDIERCLSMSCPETIVHKLQMRRQKCSGFILEENFHNFIFTNTYNVEFFKLSGKLNKNIPCATTDVDVIKENGLMRVIAAKDIEIGKVVAVEPTFACTLNENNETISCRYCHKFSLNLIPCKNCCSSMYCDEKCLKQHSDEYHKIECHIMHLIDSLSLNECLPVVTALKLRQMCDTWEDFVAYSLKVGNTGDETTVSEVYNHKHISSILCFNDDKHFVHGKIFNGSIIYAFVIKHLSEIPGYMPEGLHEKLEAQEALARIMLSLYIYHSALNIENSAIDRGTREVCNRPEPNLGFFSFACKLTHSCEPNLLTVGLGNKLALISIKPVRKGSELTISTMGHWMESSCCKTRPEALFQRQELRCRCRVCLHQWSASNVRCEDISNAQARCLRKWRSIMKTVDGDREKFRETCYAFKMFQDSPHTIEYASVFIEFRNLLLLFQVAFTGNCVIGDF